MKAGLDQKYAELIYEGFWFSPYRDALQAFNDVHNVAVTGEVTVRLFKGTAHVVGRTSPFGLYNEALSTYGVADTFDHRASEGFIKLLGLQLQMHTRIHQDKK